MNSVFESVTRYREVSVSNEMCKTFIVAEVMVRVFFIFWTHTLPQSGRFRRKEVDRYGMSGKFTLVYLRRLHKRT